MTIPFFIRAQQKEIKETWGLNDCIEYALTQNIEVRKSILTNISNELNATQAINNKLPTLSGSIKQNFSWAKTTVNEETSSNFSDNNSTNYSVNSSVILYNGSKLNKLIEQAELDMQSGIYNSETIKESISLSILNAYLQLLFTEEQVKNAEKQIEATTEQLNFAAERLKLSIISRSDYLEIKSQLASEKLSEAKAKSQYSIAKITLMQMMELPITDDFTIRHPKSDQTINANISPNASDIYTSALAFKPEIKSAKYQKESAALNQQIAKAGYLPIVTADAGLGTDYSNRLNTGYNNQLQDKISPSIGLTISIPIFQKKQVKTNVSLAKISYQTTELLEIDTENNLRKEIEQACVDVVSAQIEYEASQEQFAANEESYQLANEKFKNGLINSVDFLFAKTNLIVAESEFLQSKYNLIFNYKILDFHKGNPLTL